MALDLESVLGAPAAPETAPAAPEAPPATAEGGGLPDEVLQIPEMSALLAGTPPAVWVERQDPSPEVATVMKNKDALIDAGFGFYGAQNGTDVVFFNSQYTDPIELQALDKKGKIREFATKFEDLQASLGSATGAPEAAPAGAPPQMAASSPGAGFDKKLATKRMANLAVGSPTSGQAPGQGRILNSILQPTV